MASGRVRRGAASALAASLLLAGCWFGGDDDDAEPPATSVPDGEEAGGVAPPTVNIEGAGLASTAQLSLRLSDGEALDAVVEPVEVVRGDPLDPTVAAALFDRLPPWAVPDTDRTEFERPPQTLPPPIPGTVVEGVFPPAGDVAVPTEPAVGPLAVVRYQPEGPVETAPFIAVTFDQPMVALGTLDQLDDADVPVLVTPEVDGRWRWIGTRTLRFELEPGPLDRLPAATEYTVLVPAGTTSATGGSLPADVTWSFTTPPPSVTSFVGDQESSPLDPVFVAVFDQRVDPASVIPAIDIEVDGESVPVRLATADEVAADDRARPAVDAALDGRAVAFRASSDLPPDTAFRVRIGPGVPSAEGPLESTAPSTHDGRTFGSLRVTDTTCDQGDGCTPATPLGIQFSNVLDPDAFIASQIRVEPAIPGLSINVFGSFVELQGSTSGSTTYTVTLAGDLVDVFGQTLGEQTTVDFRVGRARPALLGLTSNWITTDPGATTPQVSVTSINHESIRVRAWAVTPAELSEFRAYQEAMWRDADAPTPEWTLVLDDVLDVDADDDEWTESVIDLEPAFAQSGSQIVLRVEPTRQFADSDDDYWRNQPTIAWVQSTTLGIDAFVDHERLVIWTTDLATGSPVAGVPVELLGDGRVATTDDEGLAELELGETPILGLWADSGERTSLLPSIDRNWVAEEVRDETRWYVFDDRGIYRPGETARITGWLRNVDANEDFQLRRFDGELSVAYDVRDAQGAELASGSAAVNPLGGFNLMVEIPAGANLGQAWVDLRLVGAEKPADGFGHTFSIQEFRRPEFEVTTASESPAPHVLTAPTTLRVDADYFSGGPLAAAPVDWLVTKRETTYSPPNWDDFTFGIWTPWWFAGDGAFDSASRGALSDPCFDCGPDAQLEFEQFSGTTDAGGTHFLRIDFDADGVDLPTTVTAEATVFDVNRQAFASRTDLLVHAAELYVGLRSDRAFVRAGAPMRVDAVVTDIDGGTVPGREVMVTAGRLEWVRSGDEWAEQLADEQTCTIVSSGDPSDGTMSCDFDTSVGGTYRVTASVRDDGGGINRTELTQWVSGGDGRPQRGVAQESVTIVPDRATYAPGDTAELLVQAPFAPAHGVMTIQRGGIVSTEAFVTEDGSAILEIPIDDAWVPGVDIQIDLAGSAQRLDDDGRPVPDAPPRPAFATGQIALAIPPVTRALQVTAEPAEREVAPGGRTTLDVTVLDSNGEVVEGADVAVVVVDEAVLSLTGFDLADPLDVFYRTIWSRLSTAYVRSSIVLARSDLVDAGRDDLASRQAVTTTADALEEAGDDSADGAGGGSPASIDLRTNFDALAVYAPSESTDAAGKVTVEVPLPDNLTRYRVMAVAVDGDERFGKGESSITARLPLQIRPSAPRFLNFGDAFQLPIVVQNQTDEPLEVDVAVQFSNLTSTGTVGQRVTVPANDRIEVRFPATAESVGTARMRVVAVSGDHADAAELELPVYTPATAEAFATYGVLDEGAIAQPTLAPVDVWPQFGGLEINTSSTALQALTDAVLYLSEYRYESSDGLAARIMAVATLRDVLDAFDAGGLPPPAELNAEVARDIEMLAGLQNEDGGFPWWQRGRESVPWSSITATHALVAARAAGYDVPADTLRRALDHLSSIEDFIPSTWSASVRDSLSAYALSVRNLAGERDATKALALYQRAGEVLELDAVAWLWPSIVDPATRDEIARRFENAAVDTAGAATFATGYGEDAYVIAHSDRRTDGIILDALITETPDSDLIPKVVAGLLAGQRQGRWHGVHENAFILMAMNRYFDTFEAVTPDFVARAWLGDLYAAEATFDGRTTDRATTVVPMGDVIAAGDSTLVLAKDGDGRLYYRLGLRYAPSDLQLDPRDEGFVVERRYEAVDDPDDVRRGDDGSWIVRAGARVRVTLTMVADARRTHVALVDPLPGGFEPLNPALAVTQTTRPIDNGDAGARGWGWWWNWFEHQNLRDDRVEAFATTLDAGTYDYTYVARATTPGTFVAPPARAEEIYAPEVFGRSKTELVVIE